jgi:hypothetical protein
MLAFLTRFFHHSLWVYIAFMSFCTLERLPYGRVKKNPKKIPLANLQQFTKKQQRNQSKKRHTPNVSLASSVDIHDSSPLFFVFGCCFLLSD